MTRTTNSGYGIVRLDDKHGAVKPGEEGVIIATKEERVGEWLRELVVPCMKYPQVLRDATSEKKFSKQAQLPGMTMAFIEVGFFGEAMIGCLDRLRKRYPQLRIVLFAVSEYQPEETARYVFWSKGSFVSLRDEPEEIEKQLRAIFRGRNYIPESIVQIMGNYELETEKPPYLTLQEIEVVRCIAHEKSGIETARCLKVSVSTVNNQLCNIRDKFGIRNKIGILKLAVTQGILSENELRSYRFEPRGKPPISETK